MLAAVWLMLSSLLYSLQLSTGRFPRPLTLQEEQYYLKLSAQGDMRIAPLFLFYTCFSLASMQKESAKHDSFTRGDIAS